MLRENSKEETLSVKAPTPCPVQCTVLAAGTWGISLAILLHEQGHALRIWDPDAQRTADLRRTRRHPRLPQVQLPDAMEFYATLSPCIANCEVFICAAPSAYLRDTCRALAQEGVSRGLFVLCCKGIEPDTLALPHEVARQVLPKGMEIAILSGPSHAEEVSRHLPAAVTAAASDEALARRLQRLFMSTRFRVYTSTDLTGVALGGALKNVIAIACGVSDGLGFGDNAKAALLTRGLSEMLRLGLALGARAETLYGLAGMGDLVVTCMSRHSRNTRFGRLLGEGARPAQALAAIGMVVEGAHTVVAAQMLAQRCGVELPVVQMVARILNEVLSPHEACRQLLMREAKEEAG